MIELCFWLFGVTGGYILGRLFYNVKHEDIIEQIIKFSLGYWVLYFVEKMLI